MSNTSAYQDRVADGGAPQLTGEGSPWARDEVEQALLEVRALIETTVAKHRDRSQQNRLVAAIDADGGSVVEAAAQLMAEATRQVDILLAAEPARTGPMLAALEPVLAAAGGALKVRLLCTRATLDQTTVEGDSWTERGVEIRIAALPFMETVLVDGRAAVAHAKRTGRREAAVIHAAPVIHALQALFESIWCKAGPLNERIAFGAGARTDFACQILLRLHAGATDEAAARELSVSVRTYRRYVAEIIESLGANSRFQAGVRAAELGLLSAGPLTELRARAIVPRPREPSALE